MAQRLAKKLLNDELNVSDFRKWLEESHLENPKYQEFSEICNQKDFVTYFLNTLHELCTREQTSELLIKPKIQNTSNELLRTKQNIFNGSRSPANNSSHSSQNTLDMTCTTSTPKHGRSLCGSSFDKNYSPIITNSNSKNGNTPSNSSFCLGDFVVANKKNSSKKKSNKKGNNSSSNLDEKTTVKKLKPTNLNNSQFNSIHLKSGNSYNFQNNSEEVSCEKGSRDFMIREISTIINVRSESHSLDKISELKVENINSVHPKNVRYKKKIENVVIVYEILLRHGFVLSLVGELYFIITLLLSKNSCDISDCDIENISKDTVTLDIVFNNNDNITFFATSMLERITDLLKSLDKTTLKHLCDNERLKLFSPILVEKLQKITHDKVEYNSNLYSSNVKNNICFVLETDNQSNFPSDGSFQGFKKQRDMFYDILRSWENSHLKPQWDLDRALGWKVRDLVGFHKDPVNFIRLSRLFMEQLLNACSKKATTSDKSSDLLSSLSNLDKDKIDRLKTRLMKKPTNGINSTPDFCGYQEFFRDFIESSKNPIFIRHLSNVLISEIIELNGTTFDVLDADSNEREAELDTKKAYVSCLKSLKTLAKFLGYIESMPYKNENNHSHEMLTLQIKIRDQLNPSLNIQKLLQDSLSSGTLTLLVPWLCEYLSMLDTVTLRTKYYIDVIKTLTILYRYIVRMESILPFYNSLLIQYSLGWFFELSHFPHNVFFENLMEDRSELKTKLQKSVGFDRLSIVDDNILKIFCPFLEEFRKLLANETAVKDRITSRHITPLSNLDHSKETVKKKMEIQLEEAFFASHPSSLKKTVDFVAERVASTCVKHLCYSVVPDYKKEFVALLQTTLKQWSAEEGIDQTELRSRCTKLAEEKMTELKALCVEEVNKIIQSRVKAAIEALLPMDYLPSMRNVCIATTERMSQEKVQQWASTHITISLFSREVKLEMKNCNDLLHNKAKTKPSYTLPPCGNDVPFDPSTESAAHSINRIRCLAASLLTNRGDITEEILIQALDDVYKSMTKRNDVNDMVVRMIGTQLVDLMILLVVHQPSTFIETKEHFIKIWKLSGEQSEELFANLICIRNFKAIGKSRSLSRSLNAKAEACVVLFEEKLLSCECFETQCISLFKYDLDENMLGTVTSFFKDFVEKYQKRCKSSKFTYLLEFLSEYCSDL